MRHSRDDWRYHWLRRPRTNRERRLENLGSDWADEFGKIRVRGRRTAPNLPTWYDDIPHCKQKTWKKRRKTQHREHGLRHDENRHEILIGHPKWGRMSSWMYEDYFETFDIPFEKEAIREHYWWFSDIYRQWRHHTRIVAYRIVWWSKKDIGIEYLKGCESVDPVVEGDYTLLPKGYLDND